MSAVMMNVVNEALDLPVDARIGLIDRLLESLNLPARPEIERLWSEEAERRIAEIDRGDVALIPGETVFARIKENYGR